MGNDQLLTVKITFKYPRRTAAFGNVRFTTTDEGMFYMHFGVCEVLGHSLRDILFVEIEYHKDRKRRK